MIRLRFPLQMVRHWIIMDLLLVSSHVVIMQAVVGVYPVCERSVQQVSGLSVDEAFGLPGAA